MMLQKSTWQRLGVEGEKEEKEEKEGGEREEEKEGGGTGDLSKSTHSLETKSNVGHCST